MSLFLLYEEYSRELWPGYQQQSGDGAAYMQRGKTALTCNMTPYSIFAGLLVRRLSAE
jgi:hypothetical protein